MFSLRRKKPAIIAAMVLASLLVSSPSFATVSSGVIVYTDGNGSGNAEQKAKDAEQNATEKEKEAESKEKAESQKAEEAKKSEENSKKSEEAAKKAEEEAKKAEEAAKRKRESEIYDEWFTATNVPFSTPVGPDGQPVDSMVAGNTAKPGVGTTSAGPNKAAGRAGGGKTGGGGANRQSGKSGPPRGPAKS